MFKQFLFKALLETANNRTENVVSVNVDILDGRVVRELFKKE